MFSTLIGVLIISACSNSDHVEDASNRTPAAKVGRLAPEFNLTGIDGNEIILSNFRGKIIIVNFWATWCPPCREEMPAINTQYQQYKDQGVEVIGISMMESEKRVREFVEDSNYDWNFAVDKKGEVTRDYRIVAIPTSYFIDEEGIIRAIHRGPMNISDIEDQLNKTMG